MKDLIQRIEDNKGRLTGSEHRLVEELLSLQDESVPTARILADRAGCSEATTVRLAKKLGYPGYPELRDALRDLRAAGNTAEAERTEQAKESAQAEAETPDVPDEPDVSKHYDFAPRKISVKAQILADYYEKEASNLADCYAHADPGIIDTAVRLLWDARRVYVVGVRNALPAAQLFAFDLQFLRNSVILVRDNGTNEIFEQLMDIGAQDLLVCISLPRYSLRTLRAMELANRRSASIISLSDNPHSPMHLYSSVNLYAPSEGSSVLDSSTAAVSLLQGLIHVLAQDHPRAIEARRTAMAQLWQEYQSYGTDELSPS